MTPRTIPLALLLFVAGLSAGPLREGRVAFSVEVGGSLSVGELLPIEFKPSPTADWSILVPVPLFPGNGMDVGMAVEYYPTRRLGLRGLWGTQIPVQPMAALPSYLKDVTGSYHRFGLDVTAYTSLGDCCLDVGLGAFFVKARYAFLFNDFTTQEEDWETVRGDLWTLGITPQMGFDIFFTENLSLGGRLLAPISLVSHDGDDQTDSEGFGNHGGGLGLRLHAKRYL